MDEILHENEWLSLRVIRKPGAGIHGYVYSHEKRCKGRIVAVLGFRENPSRGREYLLRREVTPCWTLEPTLSAVTGGWEGGDLRDDVVRELLEETGYKVEVSELIPLGVSYASKSSDTLYCLFAVDLTGREQGELVGDGSEVEAAGDAVWVTAPTLAEVRDPQVSVMYLRLGALRWKRAMER